MCGFVHSTFFNVPVNLIGCLSSNSAAKEWWASSREPPSTAVNNAISTNLFISTSVTVYGTAPATERFNTEAAEGTEGRVSIPVGPTGRPRRSYHLHVQSPSVCSAYLCV